MVENPESNRYDAGYAEQVDWVLELRDVAVAVGVVLVTVGAGGVSGEARCPGSPVGRIFTDYSSGDYCLGGTGSNTGSRNGRRTAT